MQIVRNDRQINVTKQCSIWASGDGDGVGVGVGVGGDSNCHSLSNRFAICISSVM